MENQSDSEMKKYYRILPAVPSLKTTVLQENFPTIKGISLQKLHGLHHIVLTIGAESYQIWITDLQKGLEIDYPMFKGCEKSKIIFFVKDDRLYISTEFKDLEKQETVGFIEFNHWKIYKQNRLFVKSDDERLEVLDKQHYIVFSISYQFWGGTTNLIELAGYFINPSSVLVIQNDTTTRERWDILCFPKSDTSWKSKAENEIYNIKSIF